MQPFNTFFTLFQFIAHKKFEKGIQKNQYQFLKKNVIFTFQKNLGQQVSSNNGKNFPLHKFDRLTYITSSLRLTDVA